MTAGFSPELALAAACCRWPPSPSRDAAVRGTASVPIDWGRFERVVTRHRVWPLVRDGLRRAEVMVPPAFEQRQAEAAAQAGSIALAMARETIRLQQSFDEAGLPALFVKGATLAMLGYGSVGMKQSWDIDLLTTPEAAGKARRLLLRLGYALTSPAGLDDDRKFSRFTKLGKEVVFFNPATAISVELHWRLMDHELLLPDIDSGSPTRAVLLGGREVRTLDDEYLFAYLCVHGCRDAWHRLKWLADLNAFLAGRDGTEIERLFRVAIRLGAGLAPASALLLCQRLFGLDLPDGLEPEFRADRAAHKFERVSLRALSYGGGADEFSVYSRPGLGMIRSHFMLVEGRRYFWREAQFKWVSATDRVNIQLPQRLSFLYYLLRVPLWLGRRARAAFVR